MGKPQLTPELDQFAESFNNDSDFRPCRASEAPREMTHFDFLEAHTKFLCLSQNFGVYHRANRSDLNAFEHLPPKQLVCTVDIANVDPKHDTHEEIPPQRIDKPVRWIMPFGAISRYNIKLLCVLDKFRQLPETKLAIGICEKDQLVQCRNYAAFKGCSVPTIDRVMDNPYTGIGVRKLTANYFSVVRTTVVIISHSSASCDKVSYADLTVAAIFSASLNAGKIKVSVFHILKQRFVGRTVRYRVQMIFGNRVSGFA
jgi:hypothetical protein